MTKQSILFELGCEELPSQSVYMLGEALANQTEKVSQELGLSYDTLQFFATPRRLAIYLTGVPEQLAPQLISRKGPHEKMALDSQGKPTQALLGFAKSCGVSVDKLSLQQSNKGGWYVYENTSPGASTQTILPELFKRVLDALPIAKAMHWGNQQGPFARPVHWIVLMFGNQLIPTEFFGIKSAAITYGHRYHHPDGYEISSPEQYESSLSKLNVIVDFTKRKSQVLNLINEAAKKYDATPVIPEALLDEITSIVEWPCVLAGEFSPSFLRVPQEVLIASMQNHQKCVPLKDNAGKLLPRFLTIANIESQMPEQVVLGNEKVMAARLSDADFFFMQDKKQKLEHFFPMLEQTLLHEKLGSLAAQVRRVEQVALLLGEKLKLDKDKIKLAVRLSKCDLMTGMVGEFPELQGIIGYYYAQDEGISSDVALAIKEHYAPRFSQDTLPSTSLGMLVSLVNRLDNLVGAFGIGQKPTGVKDPYKLRRHALAVIRLLASSNTGIKLSDVIKDVAASFPKEVLTHFSVEELKIFILERLPAFYAQQDISADIVASVNAVQSEDLFDQVRRIHALHASRLELSPLMGGIKRVSQLLKSVDKKSLTQYIEQNRFELPEEHALYEAIEKTAKEIGSFYQSGDYAAILIYLAQLRPYIDSFFDSVMIMVDNEAIRMNRLKLLCLLQEVLLGVADLSLLQV